MDKIVKYQNDMNKLNFKGFTQTDMNLFVALCSQMKENDTKKIILPFTIIKNLTKFEEKKKKSNDFIEALKQMNVKLMSVNCEIITESKIIMFVLFPTFQIDTENETLTVAVNEEFTWLLNEMKNYTAFELAEFINLDSKYTKNLYRLLKQFRTTGKLIVNDVESFKEKLDSPKSYKLKDFKRFVLDVAVQELQEKEIFKNLVCTPQKARKRGSPVIGYTFTFDPEVVPQKSQEEDLELEKAAASSSHSNNSNYKKPVYKNRFNDFTQTYYDFDALEREILSN